MSRAGTRRQTHCKNDVDGNTAEWIGLGNKECIGKELEGRHTPRTTWMGT